MIRICAWCSKFMGTNSILPVDDITHTICPACRTKVLQENKTPWIFDPEKLIMDEKYLDYKKIATIEILKILDGWRSTGEFSTVGNGDG